MATASKVVFFSASPFGTGDIKTGSPTLTISSGVATLTVAQTGNIGAGCEIDFGASNTKVYIAPCRIAFTSGGIASIVIGQKLRGVDSGAIGIVRAIELTSGSWAAGTAAGYIYFRKVTGTFNSNENLNKVRPVYYSNIATTNGNLQGNMSTTFVVKDPDGTETDNVGSAQTVNSISHVASSLDGVDAIYTGANYINNTDFTVAGADVMPHICGYYDHDDQTLDTTNLTMTAITEDISHCPYFYTPQGNEESVNDQRHDGKWNSNRYIIETTSNDVIAISEISRFEGFQVHQNGDSASNGIIITSTGYYTYVGYNIVKATIGGGDVDCVGICVSGGDRIVIWNNIVYDFSNAGKVNEGIQVPTNCYGYNNTVHNCYNSFSADGGHLINNISQDPLNVDYNNTPALNSTHNIGNGATVSSLAFGQKYKTGQADDTAANKLKDADANFITNGVLVGCVVKNTTDTTYTRVTALDSEGQLSLNDDIFVNGENYEIYTNKIGDVTFNNEGADDFHLGGGDTFAKNLGTNLSADTYYPFWDDIDGDERL